MENRNMEDEEFSNEFDKYGLQPIHWASLSYNVNILKWMMKKKCNIESSSINGWRPIHFATFAGDAEMVKCLIENYCKLDCLTDRGETISDVANGDCEHEFIDEILNGTNLRAALSMGLKCSVDCDHHKLCFTSVARGDFGKSKLIGSGSFGKVFKVRDSQSDRIFAVRTSKKYEFDGSKSILSNINRYLTKVDHENIIKYYGKIETLAKWKIFMEWMEKGSLDDEIESTGSLSDDKIARYSKDILRGVAFLHHNEIIHRDINPKKILIDSNERCKLSLSTFSRFLVNDEMVTTICGTMNYVAPERFNYESYNYPADIWSVGATVIHMLTGHPPYHEWLSLVVGATIKLQYRPPRPISYEMQQFIDDMTKPEPEERPTTDRLLNYELIRNASINCEINNSNIDQSIIDYSIINRQSCTDLIRRTINNQQGSLYQKIKKNKYNPLPLTTIKQYTKQILEGLKFLHQKNIIHRDIKSANILINRNNIVKIADFGVSRFLRTISKHQKKTFCGTYNYISPEVINDEPYDISADIWSLGATVFEMATGHPPYHKMHEADVIFKIGNDKTIEYPPNMSDDIKRFLNLMINAEPKNRSSADSLLSCEFFK